MIFLVIALLVIMIIALAFTNPWSKLYDFLVISEQPRESDAIIVLSGSSERDIYAAELYNLGFSGKIIMSGRRASEIMAERAIKKGVNKEDIIVELKAMTTYENATFTRQIMLDNGFQSAIVVSSPFHMRRSRLVFERVYKNTGISLTYCAVPPNLSTDTQRAPAVFRQSVVVEYVKLIYYWFRYW
jgi:uncharacterized SAM-binding protein YcdF (DUF218 family)